MKPETHIGSSPEALKTCGANDAMGPEPRPNDGYPTREPTPYDHLTAELSTLKGLIESQGSVLGDLAARDDVMCQLHERLARGDERAWERHVVVPLARQIAPLYQRVREQMEHLQRAVEALPEPFRGHSPYQWMLNALRGIQADLASVLEAFGVEIFCSPNERFDRTRHEIVELVPTDDPARHRRIAKRLAAGFRTNERTIIPERVAVFVSGTNGKQRSSTQNGKESITC